MTHRAGQIVDALAALLRARVEPQGAHVFTHRRLSLAPEQDELQAYSVDFGTDEPAVESTAFIDSILAVPVTSVAYATDEPDLRIALLAQRREVHRTIMADAKLGLEFVINTAYGGALEPTLTNEGQYLAGNLTSLWLVTYRMNITDPGD